MPTYDIELFWQCSTCTHISGGLHKECENCGKPRTEAEKDIWPEDLSQANAITDPEKIKQAHAGADWKCKFCNASQRGDKNHCKQCGSDQRQGREIHQDTKEVILDGDTNAKLDEHVIKDTPAAESTVTSEQMIKEDMAKEGQKVAFSPEEVREEVQQPSSASSTPPPPNEDETPRGVPRRFLRPATLARGIGLGLLAVTMSSILWFLLRTRVVDAHVSAVEWGRSVHVDRYHIFHREGWNTDYGAFEVQSEGQRLHHYDHVRIGSHQERYTVQVTCGQSCSTPSCYTTSKSCTSNKNGSATCTGGDRICPSPVCSPKYCSEPRTRTVDDYEDQPRYQMWYSWRVWDWGHDRDVTSGGNSTDIAWASPEQIHLGIGLRQGEQEREAGREEWFKVHFSDNEDNWKYTPNSAEDFKRFPVGQRYKIKVNRLGSVDILPPGQQ